MKAKAGISILLAAFIVGVAVWLKIRRKKS